MGFEVETDEYTKKNGEVKEKKVIKMGLVEFIVFFVLLLMVFILAICMGLKAYYFEPNTSGIIRNVKESKSIDYNEKTSTFIDELRFNTEDETLNNIMNLAINNTFNGKEIEIDGTKKTLSSSENENYAVILGLKTGDVVESKDGSIIQYRIYDGDIVKVLDADKNLVTENMIDGQNFIKNELNLSYLNMLVMPEVYKIVVENKPTEYVITGISDHYSATEEYTISKATNKLVKAKIKNGAIGISTEVNF